MIAVPSIRPVTMRDVPERELEEDAVPQGEDGDRAEPGGEGDRERDREPAGGKTEELVHRRLP
jgi:hypothetical protein